MDVSLVIACYNDGPHLEVSLSEIENTLNQTHYTYEFIIIDDCSPDGSAKIAQLCAEQRPHARCVLHERNQGRGATVCEGLKMAQGKYIGFLDIDLEVHCRYIPSMIWALEEGYDAATAYRVYEIQWNADTFFRHVLSVTYRRLVKWMLDLSYKDTETGFKFFRRERVVPILEQCQSPGWFWDTEIMALCHAYGLQVKEIPALFLRRWDKKSTVRPVRDSLIYLRELYRFKKRFKPETQK